MHFHVSGWEGTYAYAVCEGCLGPRHLAGSRVQGAELGQRVLLWAVLQHEISNAPPTVLRPPHPFHNLTGGSFNRNISPRKVVSASVAWWFGAESVVL